MFRVVYYDGIMINEVWFDTDKQQLEFSLSHLNYKILEWKKYERREDAKPLNSFTY